MQKIKQQSSCDSAAESYVMLANSLQYQGILEAERHQRSFGRPEGPSASLTLRTVYMLACLT